MNKFVRCAAVVAALYAPINASADWSIMGLGTLGGVSSSAHGINDSGQIIGSYFINSANKAFITGQDGIGIEDIGTLGGNSTRITGINSSGQIAGTSETSGGIPHTFFRDSNSSILIDIGKNITDKASLGGAINDNGVIVGSYFNSGDNKLHAFVSNTDGSLIKDIGEDGFGSSPVAINNSGKIAMNGEINVASDVHAFISENSDGNFTDIGTLGGKLSSTSDINNLGQMVGTSNVNTEVWGNAFVTGPDGIGLINLGTLGGKDSVATGINDLGEVVGNSTINMNLSNSERHAFLYSHGGMTDLSALDVVLSNGWTNLGVIDLNNNGQIVGYATNSNGVQEAILLSYTPDTSFDPREIFIPSAIPEPTTWVMLLAGLGLLGAVGRSINYIPKDIPI